MFPNYWIQKRHSQGAQKWQTWFPLGGMCNKLLHTFSFVNVWFSTFSRVYFTLTHQFPYRLLPDPVMTQKQLPNWINDNSTKLVEKVTVIQRRQRHVIGEKWLPDSIVVRILCSYCHRPGVSFIKTCKTVKKSTKYVRKSRPYRQENWYSSHTHTHSCIQWPLMNLTF